MKELLHIANFYISSERLLVLYIGTCRILFERLCQYIGDSPMRLSLDFFLMFKLPVLHNIYIHRDLLLDLSL